MEREAAWAACGDATASPPGLPRLTELLQRASGDAPSAPESDALEAVVLDVVHQARSAYPGIEVPIEAYLRYLAERLPEGAPAPIALRKLHIADLYLACACARGDSDAIAAFDARCLYHLDRVLSKMGATADLVAEVKQELRSRLLIGDSQCGPHILHFSGRGDLRGWVRVIAVRQLVKCQHRVRREVAVEDDELCAQIATDGNPAIDHAKLLYRQEFQDAFRGALQALPDRERILLRQRYLDDLSIDELGALYRIHRSTAARLLSRARLRVLEATRARLMNRLAVPSAELDSILQLIQSRIDISLGILRQSPT